MITAETIKQAKLNIDKQSANKLGFYHTNNSLHFKSFVIGLVVGLTVSGFILIKLI